MTNAGQDQRHHLRGSVDYCWHPVVSNPTMVGNGRPAMTWGLIIAVVGSMLAFYTHLIHAFTLPKLACICLGLLIACLFQNSRGVDQKIKGIVTLYGICLGISFIFSRNHMLSLVGYFGVFNGSILTFMICALGALLASKETEAGARMIRKAAISAGVVVVLYACLQAFGFDPFKIGMATGQKAVSTEGGSIDLGALMVVLLSYNPSIIWLVGLAACKSWGAAIAGIVAILPAKWKVDGFLMVATIGLVAVLTSPRISDNYRRKIWANAISHNTIKTMLVGSGPATFAIKSVEHPIAGHASIATHAHCSILEAFSSGGVLGLLGLLVLALAPQLAGLWTVCLFNPVSFEVIFVASVLLGLNCCKGE